MSNAPKALLDAKEYIHKAFGIKDPNAVGIVGGSGHKGGYHCGSDRVVPGDYSVHESRRDRDGLSMYASAIDIGTFKVGKLNLRHFSNWLVAQCKAGASDTKNIREVIYTTDGVRVRRWDRLGIRTSGDDTHLTHTHISVFRDASNKPIKSLFERYVREYTMSLSDEILKLTPAAKEALARVFWGFDPNDPSKNGITNPASRPDAETNKTVTPGWWASDLYARVVDYDKKLVELKQLVGEKSTGNYIQLTDAQFELLLTKLKG